jgi:hypothetical protein
MQLDHQRYVPVWPEFFLPLAAQHFLFLCEQFQNIFLQTDSAKKAEKLQSIPAQETRTKQGVGFLQMISKNLPSDFSLNKNGNNSSRAILTS